MPTTRDALELEMLSTRARSCLLAGDSMHFSTGDTKASRPELMLEESLQFSFRDRSFAFVLATVARGCGYYVNEHPTIEAFRSSLDGYEQTLEHAAVVLPDGRHAAELRPLQVFGSARDTLAT